MWSVLCIIDCGVKVIKLTNCKWCGSEFIKKHNRQVYCSGYCSKEARLENNRERFQKHYKTHIKNGEIQTYQKYKKDLGTGSLSMHPNPNINIELQLIKKEMERLKIKA